MSVDAKVMARAFAAIRAEDLIWTRAVQRYFLGREDVPTDIGVWVMPDNQNTGMLEDWAKQCLHPQERALFAHARESVKNLPEPPKFKPLQRSKAEVATWLAWQSRHRGVGHQG